ncbi:hypothetical protein BHU62_12025 [Serratia marcescens]|uniref:UmuC domain-containing protein n=1 Tax=Serratia marcescens TaxID=615 RepID=A0A1Q4P0F2_SERMA|nr:hypothetical protein BHU62_12025 [Serratia marcescens]
MFALVDVNSFYASCETIFRPDLRGRPVIVLSNNDGCVIARSAEAKALGVPMGAPYFKIKEEIRRRNVAVFSSNYALYADMSRRVMDTLEEMAPAVEIYSLDKSKLYSVVTQAVESELWTCLNVLRGLHGDTGTHSFCTPHSRA